MHDGEFTMLRQPSLRTTVVPETSLGDEIWTPTPGVAPPQSRRPSPSVHLLRCASAMARVAGARSSRLCTPGFRNHDAA